MHPNKGDTTADEKVAQSRWIFFNTPLKRLHKKTTKKNENTYIKDFIFISNGQALDYINSAAAYQKLKQKNWPALGFLLLAFTPPVQTTNGASVADFPLGMVAGPMLAAGNIFVAINANKQFQSELQNNILLGSTIKPQETRYGIIIINAAEEMPIEIKF